MLKGLDDILDKSDESRDVTTSGFSNSRVDIFSETVKASGKDGIRSFGESMADKLARPAVVVAQ